MKAVVFHGVGDIRLDQVADPGLKEPTDVILKLTANAICGTDLHMVRGSMPGMEPGTILGHEGVGVVEEVGQGVRNLRPGDRVVVPSTIGCGSCSYCRAGYHSQCDVANPNGPLAGTAFYGGPRQTGPFDGLQAEYARIPYANASLVRLPDGLDDERAILLSDIFPTGWFGAELAEVGDGDTVAVFGCGPVGQFAIMSARLKGADRIIAVDQFPDRLDMARAQGAETVDFSREDPVEIIRSLTGGSGADRVIDAVGVDAMSPPGQQPEKGPRSASPEARREGGDFLAGNAPFQAIDWAVQAVAKAGSVGVIGVYPETAQSFALGKAMNRNLTIKMGNCTHRRIIPHLVDLVAGGVVDPRTILTRQEKLVSAIDAYREFEQHHPGWIKVELTPGA